MLTDRYQDALTFANLLHRKQVRKGTAIPYLTHLLAVSGLVLEYGGDEDQAIAGLLHDSIEDQSASYGGASALRLEIDRRFGAEVLRIVNACTDAEVTPKPPWKERKEAYLAHLNTTDGRVALVSCCDKLHNARAILADHRRIGNAIFDRFSVPRNETLWYYKSLADVFTSRHAGPAAADFARVVGEMHQATTVAP